MESSQKSSLKLILVLILTVPLSAVSVSSALCPTNKIAPHRRISRSWDTGYQGRTLGAFYDLLAPGAGGPQGYDPSLQEEPQKDDPHDCGDIDDYDEHDLSALTPYYRRGDEYRYGDSRLFFGLKRPHSETPGPQYPSQSQGNPQYPQYRPQPQYPQNRPQQPQYPQTQQPHRPSRPPYASGGYFENNPYRPPIQHYPSDDIKPVHDGVNEPQTTYRPNVVGGQVGHVIGVSPVSVHSPQQRPTRRPDYLITRRPDYDRYPTTSRPNYNHYPTTRRPDYDQYLTTRRPDYDHYPTRRPDYDHYPQPTTQTPYYTTRRSRPRQLSDNNDSILGSFLDLLF